MMILTKNKKLLVPKSVAFLITQLEVSIDSTYIIGSLLHKLYNIH
ncbi:hypothetical protein bcgnr5414_25700 [Bacillus cereus]|nr:hypothetical protein BC30102_p266 [Bacillus cereus]